MVRITTHACAEKLLADGFAAINKQFKLPAEFPPDVRAEVEAMKLSASLTLSDRRNALDLPLVTLDPPDSTDLDQAFCLEKSGDDIVLRYALADVAAFVATGSAIELEAWNRGVTIYGLAQKVPLYPFEISQRAASLLPDGPRPAILVSVKIDPEGNLKLGGIDRVLCRSRAKLAYPTVDLDQLPFVRQFARRMWLNEAKRGAIRFEFPEQEVVADSNAPGGVRLELRTPNFSEQVNATLSLAVNISIAELFLRHQTGLFRSMAEPEERAIKRLRFESHALAINWARKESINNLMRRLDPRKVNDKRFLMTVRRAGGRATYTPYCAEPLPRHFAIGAPYVHATAPMRRLADRYVLELAFRLANNLPVTEELSTAITNLPTTMEKGAGRARSVAQAVIDLIEAVSLQPRIGEVLQAEVVDAETKVVQPFDSAIRSRAAQLPSGVREGDIVRVRIDVADPLQRKVVLTSINA